MITLLIDGDIFAYKAAFGHESEVDLGDDVISLRADLAEIETAAQDAIAAVVDKLKADRVIVALSHDTNFRKTLYPDYKANRSARRKPIGLRHAKQHLAKKFDTRVKDSLEADDVLGILATMPAKGDGKRVIVTIDKDLLQIPGRHFNPDKDTKLVVSEAEGDLAFFTQCLTGDSTDNYPGCRGIGPKAAARIFHGEQSENCWPVAPEMWRRVVAAYERAGFDEAYALTQARLARILRNTDYDFKRKEPILWTP